jgi:hypothetical protein
MNTNELNSRKLLDATKKVSEAERDDEAMIGHSEFKSMKREGYKDQKKEGLDSYVVQHTKTKKIAEIKAGSALQAAKTLGWRPRHTKLIQVNPYEEE